MSIFLAALQTSFAQWLKLLLLRYSWWEILTCVGWNKSANLKQTEHVKQWYNKVFSPILPQQNYLCYRALSFRYKTKYNCASFKCAYIIVWKICYSLYSFLQWNSIQCFPIVYILHPLIGNSGWFVSGRTPLLKQTFVEKPEHLDFHLRKSIVT